MIIAITVFPLVIVAGMNLLSVVPANVYGYAATAGFALTAGTAGNATAMDMSNPVFLVIVSTVLGAVFGMVSGKVAGTLGANNLVILFDLKKPHYARFFIACRPISMRVAD